MTYDVPSANAHFWSADEVADVAAHAASCKSVESAVSPPGNVKALARSDVLELPVDVSARFWFAASVHAPTAIPVPSSTEPPTRT